MRLTFSTSYHLKGQHSSLWFSWENRILWHNTQIIDRNAPREREISKIEIPPASFQPPEVKMPSLPDNYQTRYLNFYSREKTTNQEWWASYPREQLVLVSSQVLVPLHHDAKLKWNPRKEICELEKRCMMRRCVRPRRCHNDGCQRDCGHSPRPLTEPTTRWCTSKKLSISLALIGDRHNLWKIQIIECYQWGKFSLNVPFPCEARGEPESDKNLSTVRSHDGLQRFVFINWRNVKVM